MRVKYGKARLRSKKRLFREAKGNRGGRKNLLRTVKETILRSRAFAFRDRRVRKRDFRRLWITRLSAACRARGLSYSSFIYGLKQANLELNRKTLSELAIHNPEVFDEIFAIAKEAAA
ncbi:MAG: 50S ribosomal protein L20 [Planctomycetota bacterium]|jgi:large subunit ribosomal protein L20